jgi:hypothetical protein
MKYCLLYDNRTFLKGKYRQPVPPRGNLSTLHGCNLLILRIEGQKCFALDQICYILIVIKFVALKILYPLGKNFDNCQPECHLSAIPEILVDELAESATNGILSICNFMGHG